MEGKTTRKTRKSIMPATGQAGPELGPDDKPFDTSHALLSPATRHTAPAAVMEKPPSSPGREETPSRPSEDAALEQDSLASEEAPARKATKIIHRHWERVCHAVPKCDACGKKGGQAGVLQRCLSCTTQLCRACVETGALEPAKGSAHPAVHVMDPEDVDWAPATREEKAAQARQKKANKAAAATAADASTTQSKGRGTAATAVKGVGLRQKSERRSSEKSPANDIRVPDIAAMAITTSVVKALGDDEPTTSSAGVTRARKRGFSPDDDADPASQCPEKHPRTTAPPETPLINSLAPLRSIMEPVPAPRLPPMSHIGYHTGGYGPYAPLTTATRVASHAAEAGPCPHPGYRRLQYDPYASDHHSPLIDRYRHHDAGHSAPPTPIGTGHRSSPSRAYNSAAHQSSDTREEPFAQGGHHRSAAFAGYPPAPRAQQYVATHPHPHPLAPPSLPLPPPYPNIQDLSSELYRDVLKTRSDYGWALPICLVHEVSRSWSRGTLHRLAASVGPANAGLDMLYAVAERVSEWVGLRNDRGLYDWLAEERERLGRIAR